MNSKKSSFLTWFSFLGYVFIFFAAVFLLYDGKFSGAEFTAFVVAFAVLCMALGFAPEIQEISIGGNVLKLREVKAEAIKAIESLKRSRIESYRVLLRLSLKTSGSFANENPVDPRNKEFCRLIDLAREDDCLYELKSEILEGLDVLLCGQLAVISQRNDKVSRCALLSPVELSPVVS